jgi:hypothetical protein
MKLRSLFHKQRERNLSAIAAKRSLAAASIRQHEYPMVSANFL